MNIEQEINALKREKTELQVLLGTASEEERIAIRSEISNIQASLTELYKRLPSEAAPAVRSVQISIDHVFVLGDDSSGKSDPHSTAIAIGKRTIVSCVHALNLVPEPKNSQLSHLKGKNASKTEAVINRFIYVEDYWIQSSISIKSNGEWSDEGRIPIKLYKFNPDNDWALFERIDGGEFSHYATIDTSASNLPAGHLPLYRSPVLVLYYPVSLLIANFTGRIIAEIQNHSTHHIYYDGSGLTRGSSGGAVHMADSSLLLGMHCEVCNEAIDYQEESNKMDIVETSKRVDSEDYPYVEVANPPKKQKFCESETIRSLSGGNEGQGRAIILSQFRRLMHYIQEIDASLEV